MFITPAAPFADATAWIQLGGTFLTGICSVIAAWIAIHKQTSNGDNRTLRQALDDLALDQTQHNHETRASLVDISGRLANVESRLVRVEDASAVK